MTDIREVTLTGNLQSQLAALCRAGDQATRGTGVSTTVIRVEDKLFVGRGIEGDPLGDKNLRQALAKTDGGDLWLGHLEGRGYGKTAMLHVGALALGGGMALMTGAHVALGLEPKVTPWISGVTALLGATIAGLSALSLHFANRAERKLDELIKGTSEPVTGNDELPGKSRGWSYRELELRKRPRALTFAPGDALPAPSVTQPERVPV